MARYRKRNAAARRRAREFADAGPLSPAEQREAAALLRELRALVRERLTAAFAVVDDPAASREERDRACAIIDAWCA